MNGEVAEWPPPPTAGSRWKREKQHTMKYFVYILRSAKTGRYYIGHCADVDRRIREHNRGKTRSTKSGVPWKLIKTEAFQSKAEAYKRERQIKKYKSGEAFKKLLPN